LHGRKNQVELCPIQERTNGLAGLETSKNKLPQKDGSKTRGTVQDRKSVGTGNLPIETARILVNPQGLSCCIAPTLSRKQGLWRKLSLTTTRHRRRRRSVQSGTNPEAQEAWMRL
jgi:hypothetical protein